MRNSHFLCLFLLVSGVGCGNSQSGLPVAAPPKLPESIAPAPAPVEVESKIDYSRVVALKVLKGPLANTASLAFSPDGKLIAAGGGIETPMTSGEIRLWD